MGKDKLRRFEECKSFPNLLEIDRTTLEVYSSVSVIDKLFNVPHPLILELGCGHAEYSVGLAKKYPKRNFIGIDIKGARLWKGAKISLESNINNLGFIRTEIELLGSVFFKDQVDEIWITFPDPQILYRRAKHRLTHLNFLKMYLKFLKPNGKIHLKTDDTFLHGYTLGLLEGLGCQILVSNHDIYNRHSRYFPQELIQIKTAYEKKFLREKKKITYIQFTIDALRDF